MVNLYSVEIERSCLSSIVKYGEKTIDFVPHITEGHFYFEPHKLIFSVIKSLLLSGQKIDTIIIIEKLKSLGLRRVEDIDIFDYLKLIEKLDSINEDSIGSYFQVLQKYYNARELTNTGKKIQDFISKNIAASSQDLISGAQKIFGEKINTYSSDNDPQDLFKNLMEEIESIGNTPVEDGIICPHNQLQKYFGNFLYGGLYTICSPAKNGKSTFILDSLRKTCEPKKVRGLYLDTELTTAEQRTRLVAALSKVNEYYIRTGKFRLDKEMLRKVREVWPIVKRMEECVDHLYVAGKPIDEIVSIIRRWHYKNIHDGVKPIIAYDYIKLTGEKISDSWKEYQVIGAKTDKLKQIAQELRCPVITAVQTNSEMDVAMSKQIKWFSNMVAMFRKKTPEEIAEHGTKFGTHMLTVTDSRNQGEAAMGFSDIVKMPDGSYKRMFFNYEVTDFNVEEKGSLLDVVGHMKNNVSLGKTSKFSKRDNEDNEEDKFIF